MTAKIIKLKPHRVTKTKTDTLEITKQVLDSWKNPPFQRPLKVNEKVRALADQIAEDDGVIPGVITLGKLGRDTYLLDGQHRAHAFRLSECEKGYADVRIHEFEDMGEMGEEFVNLNSRLVSMRPDDVLRGLEESMESLRSIRKSCPFVGYDMIRRSDTSPVVSMAQLIRCWNAATKDTPAGSGASAMVIATQFTHDDAAALIGALTLMEKAWGRDHQYARLYGALNLTLCFWLYQRVVLTQHSQKSTRMDRATFGKCMTALSASSDYLDWLLGRRLSDRDRAPAYSRIKGIVAKRYQTEIGKKPMLPSPPWAKA